MANFFRPSGEILGDDEDGSVDAAAGAPRLGNCWLYTFAGPRPHHLMDPLWPLLSLDGTDASGRQMLISGASSFVCTSSDELKCP